MNTSSHLLFLLLAAAFFSAGCQAPRTQTHTSAGQPLSMGTVPLGGSCPYLTRDDSGRIVMSWIRQEPDPDSQMVYYAVYDKKSGVFGTSIPVPSSIGVEPHGENMPKIIFRKNGGIMVLFAVKNPQPDNPYTGAVFYTQSHDQGRTWTPASLLFDDRNSFDQRYFDVSLLPTGELGVIWLDNSEPSGSTLYFATTREGHGFGPGKIIGRHTCQCCRTVLLTDTTGMIRVAWRAIIRDSIRDMVYAYSKDSGRTFSAPVRISPDNWVINGCPHSGPSMALNGDGLHFAWFTKGGVYYCHTNNNGVTFSHRQKVSDVTSARHPQIASLADNDLAIVWDEGVSFKGTSNQRIGLQMRGPDGLLMGTRYLTPDSINASFPQIMATDPQNALIAFSEGYGKKQQVSYQLIRLQP